MAITTKQGYLRKKGTSGQNEVRQAPKTLSSLVYDSARSQMLSASLLNMVERQCLGYPPFATTENYAVGAKVFNDRKLWKFTSAHTAGAWNSSEVVAWSVEDELNEIYEAIATKAPMEGEAPMLTAGAAKKLENAEPVTGSFFSRTSGGDAEIADGIVQMQEVKGRSVKVNQLVQNGNFANGTTGWSVNSPEISITATNNKLTITGSPGVNVGNYIQTEVNYTTTHKYFISVKLKPNKQTTIRLGTRGGVSSATSRFAKETIVANEWTTVKHVVTPTTGDYNILLFPNTLSVAMGEGDTMEVSNFMFIDLTAMGIDNLTTVAQVEAWLAENVGLQQYYDYNAGSVVNVNMTGVEGVSRNLLDPTTGKAQILGAYDDTYGNYYGVSGTHGTLTFTDRLGNEEIITLDSDGKFLMEREGELSVADAGSDCCVFLWWDGKKTDYVEHTTSVGRVDIAHIWGKKNGTGDRVRVWPTGAPGLDDLQDALFVEDGEVKAKRVMGEIDLGSLSYTYTNMDGYSRFVSEIISTLKQDSSGRGSNFVCAPYSYKDSGYYDKIGWISSTEKSIALVNNSYNTDAAFKTAMAGVPLYFELDTPEVYTDLVYMGSEYFADGTPVVLPVSYEADNYGIENVLPLNGSTILTAKPTITSKYSIDAMESIDTHTSDIEYIKEGYVKRSTLAQGTGESTTNAMSQKAVTEELNKLYQSLGVAEGYVRVAGSSSPALSFKHYEKTGDFGQKSAFSLFYPCLVGTKLSEEEDDQIGKIKYVLKKFGAKTATSEDTGFTEGQAVWEDLEGTLHAIDGSEGDVMIVNIEPYYRVIGKYTIDGTEYDVFLMSYKPFTWQGIVAEEVKKFGWAPDYCVSHTDTDNVVRMHSAFNPSWNGSYSAPAGVVGRYVFSVDEETSDIEETYDSTATLLGGAGGLHSTDITLYDGEQRAMNNNADTTKTVPWMNATAAGVENMFALMLAEGGTFDAHNATLMGSGFCSNDAASAAADWEESGSGAKNGLRVKDKNDAWKYYGLSSNVRFLFGESTGTRYAANCINSWRNPWHIMEAHRAVSYAIANGVHELEWFVFEGNKYKYRGVTGFNSPAQGEMTCVVWKLMVTQAGSAAVDPTDGTTSIAGNRVEILVSTALFHGMTTQVSPCWWTSGLIFTEDASQNYEAYMERDQEKLMKSPTGDKSTSENWDFETAYKHVGSFTYGEGYRKDYSNDALMIPNTNANKSGGGLHTYVGAYNWFTGSAAPSGKKSVRGFSRGGGAFSSDLSPVLMPAYYSPSFTASYIAFGTCVRIED